jgi:secondary thiamine-phosphate synthase enzyme
MKILNEKIHLNTKGTHDFVDITQRVKEVLDASGCSRGSLTLFVIGSTAAITTFEFEPGLTEDMKELYDKLIPEKKRYHHDQTWGDANGFSHLRAALQGPSLTIPFEDKKLILGIWQQLVLAEFDNRPRKRQVAVQIIGE